MTAFRKTPPLFALCLLAASFVHAQDKADLEKVLTQMDTTSKTIHSMEGDVTWDQYQRVVNDTDTQKGKIYFRRENGGTQMAVEFSEPDKKYVVYNAGKVQVYQPKIDQVNEYTAGKDRSDIESFLVLGFGSGGHDLLKSYDVKFMGTETVMGVASASKLELIPKSARLRNNIARIDLWIDNDKSILVQQQIFEPSGDYRLAKYSNIELNMKIPDSVFKLKTTAKTRFVSPQG